MFSRYCSEGVFTFVMWQHTARVGHVARVREIRIAHIILVGIPHN